MLGVLFHPACCAPAVDPMVSGSHQKCLGRSRGGLGHGGGMDVVMPSVQPSDQGS